MESNPIFKSRRKQNVDNNPTPLPPEVFTKAQSLGDVELTTNGKTKVTICKLLL